MFEESTYERKKKKTIMMIRWWRRRQQRRQCRDEITMARGVRVRARWQLYDGTRLAQKNKKEEEKRKKVVLDGNEIVHCSVDRWPANSPTLCLRPASAATRRCARVFSTKTTHARAHNHASTRRNAREIFIRHQLNEKIFLYVYIHYISDSMDNFQSQAVFKIVNFRLDTKVKKFLKVSFLDNLL